MPILDKIISGGQTGADRAALDTALKFNIPHGGWIPKGKKTESGPLPDVYQLSEMPTQDYPERTRQNILDASGTVIIARGALSGGSKLTHTFARVTGKPNCHIDLLTHDIFESAMILQSFILENHIRILNVAGPRASGDPAIYHDVRSVIEAVLYLFFLESDIQANFSPEYPKSAAAEQHPKSLTAAVDLMVSDLGLKEKAWVARLGQSQVSALYFSWLDAVRLRLGLDDTSSALMAGLKHQALWEGYTPEDGVMDCLKALKARLDQTHDLKVVS